MHAQIFNLLFIKLSVVSDVLCLGSIIIIRELILGHDGTDVNVICYQVLGRSFLLELFIFLITLPFQVFDQNYDWETSIQFETKEIFSHNRGYSYCAFQIPHLLHTLFTKF